MNVTRPNILSARSRARLRRMDPRTLDTSRLKTSISLPEVDRPQLSLPHVDLPHVDLPHVALPHLDLPRLDLPRLEFPSIEVVDYAGKSIGDAGRAAATRAGEAGRAAAAFAGEAGKAAATSIGEAGRTMGNLFDAAGDRIHDLRMSVAPPPKRPSVAQRGLVALAIASVVGSVAAAAAFFMHPVRGAARRAALRRRFRAGAREARTGVDTALVAARRATGRATELVRIPVESAKELVGSRNGHADSELDSVAEASAGVDDAEAPVLVAAGSASKSHAGKNGSHAPQDGGTEAEAVGE